MRSGSRCPAFYGEIPPMRWGILNDDGGYFYCITYRDRTGAAREAAAETALSDGGEDATVTPDIMLAQDGTDR